VDFTVRLAIFSSVLSRPAPFPVIGFGHKNRYHGLSPYLYTMDTPDEKHLSIQQPFTGR
jgi:hypothetical protein